MKEIIEGLLKLDGAIFWRDFVRVMVSAAADEKFLELQSIYVSSKGVDEAKDQLREFLKVVE